jgi:hypothetical protein
VRGGQRDSQAEERRSRAVGHLPSDQAVNHFVIDDGGLAHLCQGLLQLGAELCQHHSDGSRAGEREDDDTAGALSGHSPLSPPLHHAGSTGSTAYAGQYVTGTSCGDELDTVR